MNFKSYDLLIFTAQCGLGEERSLSACIQSWNSINTDDVQFRVLGHREPGEGKESLGQRGEFL